MKYRTLGKTNIKISEISLGTWQLGSVGGEPFDENVAKETLNEAVNPPPLNQDLKWEHSETLR